MDSYRRGVLKAIPLAQKSVFGGVSSRTDALRGIRSFEDVNGIRFDWHNKLHRFKVGGSGVHEAFFRKAKRICACEVSNG